MMPLGLILDFGEIYYVDNNGNLKNRNGQTVVDNVIFYNSTDYYFSSFTMPGMVTDGVGNMYIINGSDVIPVGISSSQIVTLNSNTWVAKSGSNLYTIDRQGTINIVKGNVEDIMCIYVPSSGVRRCFVQYRESGALRKCYFSLRSTSLNFTEHTGALNWNSYHSSVANYKNSLSEVNSRLNSGITLR